MHNKNTGERDNRSPNQTSHGLRGLVLRAKLSNAAGYDAREAPRVSKRPNSRDDLL